MNIIINGFGDPRQQEILTSIKRCDGVGKCCFIVDYDFIPEDPQDEVFRIQDIIEGEYDGSDFCLHFDEIRFINENAFVLFELMNRFYAHKHYEYGYEDKKIIIYKHFSFWLNYIRSNRMDVFISSNVPHDIYDYIIYLSFKFHNKNKNLFFLQSQFKDMIIPMEDIQRQNKDVVPAYLALLEAGDVSLSDRGKAEWEFAMSESIPFYMAKEKPWNTLVKKLLGFTPRKLGNIWKNIAYSKRNRKLRDEYNRVVGGYAADMPYVYFPLHYQPELTSCILGTQFVSQYLIVQLIDRLLPPGWRLYVKEHPKQMFCNRYFGYYEDIQKHSRRTVFLDIDTPSKRLIKGCRAVVTISGTAGWEALFYGKPVLLFGNNFNQYAPGVYHIKSEADAVDAVGAICNDRFMYDREKLEAFLVAVEQTSIQGFVDPLYASTSSFSFEQSNKNLISYIKRWLATHED